MNILLRIGLAAAAAILIAAPIAANAQTSVKIGMSGLTMNFVPAYVAEAKGYFAEEGLDVELLDSGSGFKTVAAVTNGSIDMCLCLVSGLASAVSADVSQLRLFALLNTGYSHAIVARKGFLEERGITPEAPLDARIAALKGARIGITEIGATTDNIARLVLSLGGLDPDRDATLITIQATANAIPAIANGQIDAFVGVPPSSQRSVLEGSGVIFIDVVADQLPGLSNAAYAGVGATQEYLAANPDTARAVFRAIAKAQDYIAKDWEGAKQALREGVFKDLDDESFTLGADATRGTYKPSPVVVPEEVAAAIALDVQFSGKSINVTADQIVDLGIGDTAL